MSETKYFWKGLPLYEKDKQKEIDKRCTRCYFCDEKTIRIGRILPTGEVFDNCYESSQRDSKRIQEKRSKIVEEYNNYKKTLEKLLADIEKLFSLLTSYSEIKNEIKRSNDLLKKGYVINEDNRKGGSKRYRRYKKDNRRFLTDMEMKNLSIGLKELNETFEYQQSKLKLEDKILEIFQNNKKRNSKKNINFDFKDDGCWFYNTDREIQESLNNLEIKVNAIFPTDLEKEPKFDTLKNKALQIIEEEESYYEQIEVRKKREVSRKATHYIDEKGNRVKLDSSVEQSVIYV